MAYGKAMRRIHIKLMEVIGLLNKVMMIFEETIKKITFG